MNSMKPLVIGMIIILAIMAAPAAQADMVTYALENVILDDGNVPMLGTFTWTYDVGDFENGAGEFTFLDIPYTQHDHTDLTATFDIGSSIEITLQGSVHDDGVDITLFLVEPLTPTSGADIDLTRSRFEIGGNGFHDGMFVSGRIVLAGATSVEDLAAAPSVAALRTYPNPFNPATTVAYDLARDMDVTIRVHDVAGRVVRTLVAGDRRAAGRHEISWRGRDDAGRAVASGLYFVRLRAEEQAIMRKVVLLK